MSPFPTGQVKISNEMLDVNIVGNPVDELVSSSFVMNTSETNPVDQYITGKLDGSTFAYKMACGALVGMVALQTNTMVREFTEMLIERVDGMVTRPDKMQKYLIRLAVEVIVIAIVFEVSVAVLRKAKQPPSEEEEEE